MAKAKEKTPLFVHYVGTDREAVKGAIQYLLNRNARLEAEKANESEQQSNKAGQHPAPAGEPEPGLGGQVVKDPKFII